MQAEEKQRQSMSIFLSCCFLGIFLILIWCSLQHPEESRPSSARQDSPKSHLEYIPISWALFGEWTVRDERLMTIDLRPHTLAEAHCDSIPGSLRIPLRQLGRFICHLPPNTRLVLYDKTPVIRLDSRAESALLMIGIPAVYVLEGIDCAWHAHATPKKGAIEPLPK